MYNRTTKEYLNKNKKLRNSLIKYCKKSLLITIVVLLILAGVSIATLTGENGILNKTTEAKNNTELSNISESLSMGISEIYYR